MKRYWLFGYLVYEATGGLGDLIAWADSVDGTKELTEQSLNVCGYDYYEIIDSKSLTLILQAERHRFKKAPLIWKEINVDYAADVDTNTADIVNWVPTPPKEKSVPYLP